MSLENRTPPTSQEYATYRDRFNNRGRWGANDEFGTLNHITPQVRREAAGLVREGRSISLARPLQTRPSPANPWPSAHLVGMTQAPGSGDYLAMFLHSFVDTHIDALAHASGPDGRTWNGREIGPNRMPVEHSGTVDFWSDGIVTRGVLYDVPRFRNTEFVTGGRPVHGWELQDVADSQGVKPRAGDAVIIRSGLDPYWAAASTPEQFASVAGVHASALEFFYSTDAALVIWDFQDAPESDQGLPNPTEHDIPIALHIHAIALPYMGLPLVDNANLERIAKVCAELNRWEFQVTVAPLIIPGATGSPVNPIAVI
jgi:kynurenine formamidase